MKTQINDYLYMLVFCGRIFYLNPLFDCNPLVCGVSHLLLIKKFNESLVFYLKFLIDKRKKIEDKKEEE